MASSAHKQQQHLPNFYGGGATTAPPPTPSTQSISLLSTPDAADALSRLIQRLPPTLTLPSRRSQSTTCPQAVSLAEPDHLVLDKVLSAASEFGYFQLTDHSIASHLAKSADSEVSPLFNLSKEQKATCFPKNWPLGHHGNDEDDAEDEDGLGESFYLDGSCNSESADLSLDSLKEFTRELERLGLKVVDFLCKAMGVDNPIGEDPARFCSLIWLSEAMPNSKPAISGGSYPFIVGLEYQLRCQKYYLLADSGWVSVLPHVDAVMVTVGDIAQVWSNGRLKKVRGRPVATLSDQAKESSCMKMSLLITLPTESTVSPIFPVGYVEKDEDDDGESTEDIKDMQTQEGRLFKSFSFEDYAWRVYHERLHFKDPLDRYRI